MAKRQSGKDDVKAPVSSTELGEAELDSVTGGTESSQGSGGGAGKVTLHDISITKNVDKSTPTLF